MKSIMISIQPQWVEKILNGEKTIEIRKTIPKCELPCKVYIYCTKGKHEQYTPPLSDTNYEHAFGYIINGKVVAEFTLNHYNKFDYDGLIFHDMKDIILEHSCLTDEQLCNYIQDNLGYAWHIRNLIIYDMPKELSEFKKYCNLVHNKQNIQCFKPLCKNKEICNKEQMAITRPPQSWCYVEGLYEN